MSERDGVNPSSHQEISMSSSYHGLSDHRDIATVEKPLSTIVPVTELFRLLFLVTWQSSQGKSLSPRKSSGGGRRNGSRCIPTRGRATLKYISGGVLCHLHPQVISSSYFLSQGTLNMTQTLFAIMADTRTLAHRRQHHTPHRTLL